MPGGWFPKLLRPVDLAADSKALGAMGERFAARFLRRRGFRILARNARLKQGEADIVCECPQRRDIVIVEVKTRLRGTDRSLLGELVAPEASVVEKKRRTLASISQTLARSNGWTRRRVRVDVVAIEWPAGKGRPELRHHVGVIVREPDATPSAP